MAAHRKSPRRRRANRNYSVDRLNDRLLAAREDDEVNTEVDRSPRPRRLFDARIEFVFEVAPDEQVAASVAADDGADRFGRGLMPCARAHDSRLDADDLAVGLRREDYDFAGQRGPLEQAAVSAVEHDDVFVPDFFAGGVEAARTYSSA